MRAFTRIDSVSSFVGSLGPFRMEFDWTLPHAMHEASQVRDVLDGRSERGTLLEVWRAARDSHSHGQAWTTECTEGSWSSIHQMAQATYSFAALSGIDAEHISSFFSGGAV